MADIKRVGVLTGGGDCPALNAVIRGLTRVLTQSQVEVVGMLDGWRGMLDQGHMILNWDNTDQILDEGGTILGSSRTNIYKDPETNLPLLKKTVHDLELDALVAIGGDDTLGVATRLYEEEKIPVVGCPKTIDNDLSATDATFGFDTAINRAMMAMDDLKTTTKSHHRIMVVECMGRHAGWLTAYAGMAAGADIVLVPEKSIGVPEIVAAIMNNRKRGKQWHMVAVSEGFSLGESMITQDESRDDFGHVKLGGVGERLAKVLEEETGVESRHVVLGHLQRGGPPTAADRVLGTRYGIKAAEMVLAADFGKMAALKGADIVAVPLKNATGETRVLDLEFFKNAERFWA